MTKYGLILFIAVFLFLLPFHSVSAQDDASGPVYIVQPGDTLLGIAAQFGITTQELIDVNDISNPDILSVGTQLIIPGLTGIQGVLTTTAIPLGENLFSLVREYQIDRSILIRLNRLTSPSEIYAGSYLIIPEKNSSDFPPSYKPLDKSISLFDIAIIQNENPWKTILQNQTVSDWYFLPSDSLLFTNTTSSQVTSLISPLIASLELSPLPILQGATVEINISTNLPMDLSGSLNGSSLNFFETNLNEYVALQGIHAMAPIGLALFELSGKSSGGNSFSFSQNLLVDSGNFGQDPPLQVEPATIDPAIVGPEEDLIKSIVSKVTPTRQWDGLWQQPLGDPLCVKSRFGNRRSYNGSDFTYFHAGIDFGTCATENTLSIYASAPGTVVYVGTLAVRGNATIIDHGWGVFSAYYHQESINVNIGDYVTKGQAIGIIGNTGRVTGYHLHWEVWVHGVQVQPFDWLENSYP
jgi:murein DD-endopeptidase MepM/ murein hydrolase activator NlpD